MPQASCGEAEKIVKRYLERSTSQENCAFHEWLANLNLRRSNMGISKLGLRNTQKLKDKFHASPEFYIGLRIHKPYGPFRKILS